MWQKESQRKINTFTEVLWGLPNCLSLVGVALQPPSLGSSILWIVSRPSLTPIWSVISLAWLSPAFRPKIAAIVSNVSCSALPIMLVKITRTHLSIWAEKCVEITLLLKTHFHCIRTWSERVGGKRWGSVTWWRQHKIKLINVVTSPTFVKFFRHVTSYLEQTTYYCHWV